MSPIRTACVWGLALAAALGAATATSLFAASRIRLVNEGSSGPLYECNSGRCVPAQTDDPSRKNLDGMEFYVLPAGCVAISSAALRPSGLGIDVQCGPPDHLASYRCEAGSCRPFTPGVNNDGAISWPIPLPADCGGRIHELIVLDADTGAPKFFIECDASSDPVAEV